MSIIYSNFFENRKQIYKIRYIEALQNSNAFFLYFYY